MIHSSAQIDSSAEIDDDVLIGPNTVIGPNVKILKGTVVEGNAFIHKNTVIGKESGISITNGRGNVFIGYQANDSGSVDNKLVISNGFSDIITGDFSTGNVTLNADTLVKSISTQDIDANEYNTLNNLINTPLENRLTNQEDRTEIENYTYDTNGSILSTTFYSPTCGTGTPTGGGCSCGFTGIIVKSYLDGNRWACECSVAAFANRAYLICADF